MSSFYDDASLVVIPSGYKTSKVYAEKPTDGSGDLTFTRTGDTATRVNSAGLIEKVRTNLLTYSQDFSNAAWIVDAGLTKTLSQTDPNGGTTAALFSGTSGSNLTVGHAVTLTANVPNTISIWIKGSASGSVSLRIDDSGAGPQYDINYTTSWQRFSVTKTVDQSSCVFVVGGYFTWGVGENIYLAFGQAETGDIATDYIPTTTAAVSVGPVSNVPRLDYLGSTCPRLLLEPQRTNLVTYSEQFNNAAWSKDNVSVSANTSTSPDGYVNADSIVENSANGFHFIQQTFTSSAVSMTYSIFAKLGSGTRTLILREGVNTGAFAAFNLSTGVVSAQSGGTATITQYANGYYRCTLTFTAAAGTSSMQIALSNANSFASYTGNGTSSIIVYGAQVEAGAYATSYIPTLAASATRGADACSKTGISSLIGQTEGTLYFEGSASDLATFKRIAISSGSYTSSVYIDFRNDGSVVASSWASAGLVLYQAVTPSNPLTRNKYAIAYKSNDWAVYVNGTLAASQSTGAATFNSTLNTVEFALGGNDPFTGSANELLVFKTRLTNAEMQELTTL